MSAPTKRSSTETESILREALQRRTPLVISFRNASGWRSLKSRIVEVDSANSCMHVEPPVDHNGKTDPNIATDLYLGVAFRRGHKKCLCTCVVLGPQESASNGSNGALLTLNWPDSIQTLQRRAYFRVPVPESMPTKVLIWPGLLSSKPDNPGQDRNTMYANMLDVSLGGMAVSVPSHDDCPFEPGQTVGCEFRTRDDLCVAVEAHFKHAEQKPNGETLLGFQFVGLEHGRDGRERVKALMRFTHTLTQRSRPRARRGLPRKRNSV